MDAEKRLAEKILDKVFETYWPQFEISFHKIIDKTMDDSTPVKRDEIDILSELLIATRTLDKRMRYMENNSKITRASETERELERKIGDLNNLEEENQFLRNRSKYPIGKRSVPITQSEKNTAQEKID